jgi:hypothetical protein
MGLRRQDAGANVGEADGPKGEPQDAASLSGFGNRKSLVVALFRFPVSDFRLT